MLSLSSSAAGVGVAAAPPVAAAAATSTAQESAPAARPAARAALFAAPRPSEQATKPKTRAELMQAMAARPPPASARPEAARAPAAAKAASAAVTATRVGGASEPVPAEEASPEAANDSSPPRAREVRQVSAKSPSKPASPPKAASKKRAARGAPDPIASPSNGRGKRARKVREDQDNDEDILGSDEKKGKNKSRKGMKYNTVNRQLEELKETLLRPAAEASSNEKSQSLLRKLLGLPVGEGASSSQGGKAAEEMDEETEDVENLKKQHAAEMEELKKAHEERLTKAHEEMQEKVEECEAQAEAKVLDLRKQLDEVRISTTSEVAKLIGKVELLEQQVAEEKAEKESQFVRGWNAGFEKAGGAGGSGGKTRSSSH